MSVLASISLKDSAARFHAQECVADYNVTMDLVDENLVLTAYQVLLSGQRTVQAIARKSLGEASQHAFTIDGKLLGDLGELIACLEFGLEPLPTNTRGVDAKTRDGDLV